MSADKTEFANATRDALAALHDTARLQTNPLLGWLGLASAADLREALQAIIEALRPDLELPDESPAWLTYQILVCRYLQGRSRFVICDDLALGQATYYRYHRQGLDAVADVLWRRYQQQRSGAVAVDATPEDSRSRAFSLAMRSRPEPVPLAALLGGAVELLTPLLAQRRVKVAVDIGPNLPAVYGDPAIIRQILLSALTAAVEHAAPDGLRVSLRAGEGHVVLQISGLAPSADPPIDVANGLRDSGSLLEAYGGAITLHDAGTPAARVEITLPSSQPATILIIDDDGDTIQLYSRYLQGHRYAIKVAQSADEARRLLGTRPQVVLLDILMAKEDGWDVLRYAQASQATADIPIIICSVLSQPQLALALGATAVLKKPITEHDLLAAIERAVTPADSAG
ncbi:MAG: response regulator [Chloroflexi bacterium]|jgi:CheY-like chemotaxis protein|nr:response regulator [Chloroflexota bacterium]